jgi:septum formation protein
MEKTFSVSTKVTFDKLSEEEINYYVEGFKPYDKAGAYGIQEWIGLAACSRIEGSYFNVVGLPVQRLYKELMEFV